MKLTDQHTVQTEFEQEAQFRKRALASGFTDAEIQNLLSIYARTRRDMKR